MLLRLIVGIVCFSAWLPCQETVEAQSPDGTRHKRADEGDKDNKGKIEDDPSLTPEQRMERNISTGASSYCRFQASVTPAKLLPGQTGLLRVVATLQGDAVIPAPAPFQLVSQVQQGPLLVGAHSVRPAEIGQLAAGYLGRPVYDNYFVVEMPVTMGNDATLGSKHMVAVDMKFDLYSGSSAQPIGRFLDRAMAEVEVGRSPEPTGRVRPAAAPADPGTPPAEPAPAVDPARTAPLRGNVIEPAPEVPAPVAEPSEPVAPAVDLTSGSAESELPVSFLVGGGVLLLLVVLLVARRK